MGLLLAGCESAYYGAMEKVGVHKRDILVDRVENAMEAQEDAKQEFKDALEQFSSVVDVPPSKLKSTYESLSDAFEDAEDKAQEVTDRIDAVESVSEALFDEWREEIGQISDRGLRSASTRQLQASERQYGELIKAMRRAESRMEPVLKTFRDYVLYLKHNLNAQAIASLKSELSGIESDVAALIREMEISIDRAKAFVADME
ncbi:MAG: DUF2959 domain-containing protein [Pseudomonadales bacterium]